MIYPYKIEERLSYGELELTLLDVRNRNYQESIKSNVICFNKKDNTMWIAESPKSEKNDSYWGLHIYEGELIVGTYNGLHHIINLKDGSIIRQEFIK